MTQTLVDLAEQAGLAELPAAQLPAAQLRRGTAALAVPGPAYHLPAGEVARVCTMLAPDRTRTVVTRAMPEAA